MSNTIVNITLQSKSDPTINIQTTDGGSVTSNPNFIPTINFVATGPVGAQGAQGIQGADGSGGSQLTDNSIQTSHIINGAVTGAKIANHTISASKLLSSSVSTIKLQNSSVTTEKLADNSVTAAKIANGAITNELIDVFADFAIKKEKIEYLGLDASVIALDAIITSKIKDRNVTGQKICSDPDLDGEVKCHKMKIKGLSPGLITGPDSDALHIKSNSTLDFLNTSDTIITSLDQSGNLTILGTVDGRNISTDGAKLDTISNNAQPNVKSNWNETDSNSDAFIQNKPTIPVNTDTTYNIQCVDGDNSNEQKIRLAASGSGSGDDDVVLEAGTGLSISRSGDKITFTNTVTDTDTVLTTEQVQDIVGAMFSGNTETRIAAIYDDTDGTINLIVDNIPVDLTVDGAGTVHTNNITDLHGAGVNGAANQLLTDNGDGSISSESYLTWDSSTERLSISADTSGRPELFLQSMDGADPGHLTFYKSLQASDGMDVGKIVFQATDTDGNYAVNYAEILGEIQESDYADGEGKLTLSVASHDREIQPGLIIQSGDVEDEVDVTIANGTSSVTHVSGNLTVGGTVDGIDIATDVAANTAKTSFPGFGTTAGTALEGNTVIPAAYTDADAVSAVATADDYLKNDTNEVLAGSLEINEQLFINKTTGGSKVRFRNNSTTNNRTLDVPDHDGVLATTNTLIDTKTAAYWSSSTSGFYITLSGSSTSENSSLSTASYTLMYVAPFDGKIKRISSFHQNNALGTSTFEVYIDGDDSNLTTDQRGSDMTTASYNRKFTEDCPADWTFSKGEAIAIRRTDSVARYGVTMTIVFEYDTTT